MFRWKEKYVASRDFSRKGVTYKKGEPVKLMTIIMRMLYNRRLIEPAAAEPAKPAAAEAPKKATKGKEKTDGSKRNSAPRRPDTD